MLDLHRWDPDVATRPEPRRAARDLAVRVLLPAVVWGAVVVGLGMLLDGPLRWVAEREDPVSRWFVEQRTATLDALSAFASHVGNTQWIIAVCVLVVAAVWWRTRRWWYAVVPAVALSAQVMVFLGSSALVGRSRPDVEQLDEAPPTSSFPSGHSGASTALYVTLALMAQRIRRTWLRVVLTVVLLLVPVLVMTSRLYRGMHHPSDVLVGCVNGLLCAVLGWGWLSTPRSKAADDAHAVDADGSTTTGARR
ncbi:phosphatase PAP2 family protein [Cellulomonas palmilytica]|uniref:phosphatase PAP2 family protein n=1 Tax=Cellulomonas palmilytica TaxID=2608402 RepID=UPI001F3FA6AE|nr:phosphatase PAP2 family protein [Cellulomonas palmilytica]UJP40077.1 phosphatase PAP2 family protein [Cellulomonas palmilytica]